MIFEDRLQKYLVKQTGLPDWRGYFPVTSTITGLFENINITRRSALACCDQIYAYLMCVLERVSQLFFSSQASPSLTNEILLLNHNLLRVILALCQEFGGSLRERKVDFSGLTTSLREFLDNEDVPMDTKTNCGHLTIVLSKLDDSYDELIASKFKGQKTFCVNVGIVVDLSRGDALTRQDTWSLLRLITLETIDFARENSKQQNMVLACSRLIMQISRVLPQLPLRKAEDEGLQSIVGHLVDFVIAHMENFMDSVRHMSRDSLKLILSFCLSMKLDSELERLFHRIESGCSRNVRFVSLSCIASVYGTRKILEKIPNIVDELVENFVENSFDVSAGNCYEVLMLENKKEETPTLWIELWMNPLVKFLNTVPTNDQNTKIVVETLIGKAVKNDQEIIRILIRDSAIPISMRLTVLTMAKKCGKLSSTDTHSDLWKGSIPIQDLYSAMVNFDDRVRVQSLRLVIETLKITEPYEAMDMKLLRFFFQYNANCQSPATRDQIMALYRQCFLKFAALLPHCAKRKDERSVELYTQFLMDLRTRAFANLRLNGNFSRRIMSLTFIQQICAALQSLEDGKSFVGPDEEQIDSLVKSFADSYEANKVLAMNILLNYCDATTMLRKYSAVEEIHPLVTSVNPGDSATAAYNLQLIVSLAKSNPDLYVRKLFITVQWLSSVVEEGIQMTKSSLATAAKGNPIYGAILCIRHLLLDLDVQAVRQDPMWWGFISKLITICFAASEAVKSIVNNSSPEGHLPNDFGPVSDDCATDDCNNVTPQMILLMGWRTIKEVSLLLGDISKYPLVSASSPGLVTVAEFFQIGDNFRELLAETKHRGAFEQAYVGFSILCCRLWTAREEELHSRPMVWLSELMDVVRGRVELNSKICATRRSAGVPFMVQALITSEIQVCSSRALRFSMDILFGLCESEDGTAEARTHALNILRALFRCTDLNDDVVEFVDRGVMAAISSFAGPTWPEKNSATLLFSALVIRIFGVQLTKDTEVLNVRNKMTGRIFFLRYPKLYDFFLRELDTASETLSRNGRAVKLFPILLVLSRLYPSALEGTESSLSLHAFVEKIDNCSGCSEMKTRVLVAKSIASLLTTNLAWEYLHGVLASYANAVDLNVKHTKLLIFQQVLSSPELKCKSGEINQLAKQLTALHINCSHWILTKTYLEIFIVMFERFNGSLEQPVHGLLDRLLQLEQTMLLHAKRRAEMGYDSTLSALVVLQLHINCNKEEILRYFGIEPFTEAALGVVLLIMNEERKNLPDDLEITKWEKSFVHNLPKETKNTLKQQLTDNIVIPRTCQEIVDSAKSSYDLRNKALALLAYYPASKSVAVDEERGQDSLNRLHAELLDSSVSYQARAAMYKWYLRNCEAMDHKLPLSVVERYSTIENTVDVRYTSTQILSRIPVASNIIKASSGSDDEKFISTVMLLLRDDDAEVRESMARMVGQLTGANLCQIELFAQQKFLTWISAQLERSRGGRATELILSSVVRDVEQGLQRDLSIQAFGCTDAECGNEEVVV